MKSTKGPQSSKNQHTPKAPVQTAPPVYRPASSIQQKTALPTAGKLKPAPHQNIVQAKAVEARLAPPVYRPAHAVQAKSQLTQPAVSAARMQAQPVLQARAIEARPAPPAYRPAAVMQRAVAPPMNSQAQQVNGFQNKSAAPNSPSVQRMVLPGMNKQLPGGPAAKQNAAPTPQFRPLHGHVLQRLVLTVGHVDDIIGRSVLLLAQSDGRGHAALENYASLATLPVHENLILDAHGASVQEQEVPQYALQFGGFTAEALADTLITKGLPQDYNATIYLNGCNTTTENSGQSYARRFQFALGLRGLWVRVKGNSGSSQVVKGGSTAVVPPTIEGRQRHREFSTMVGSTQGLISSVNSLSQDILGRGTTTSEERRLIGESRLLMESMSILGDMIKPTVYLEDREDLTPTLEPTGVLHYQSDAATYSAIPQDKHPTLASRVSTALDAYDNRFFKWRSDASKAARDVLRNLCNHGTYEKLFVAMSWYLTMAPRPPASIVPLNAPKLAAGDLRTSLLLVFAPWS